MLKTEIFDDLHYSLSLYSTFKYVWPFNVTLIKK